MFLDIATNSPIEQIQHELLTEKRIQLFIKRDDLIHPFISGNKWRKLQYYIKKVESSNLRGIVTFGGAWSNHLIATAAAGAKFQIKTVGYVRGEAVSNPVLTMCNLFGMELRFIDRSKYREKREIFLTNFEEKDYLFIDEGGRGKEGIVGCQSIIEELKEEYSDIFLASGTGTTTAGLLDAVNKENLKTKIHSVPVLKNGEFIKDDIASWGIITDNLILHTSYHFGGYAKTSNELLQFIKKFTSHTGILIEPVYTAKMLYAIFDLIRRDEIVAGSKLLAIHTGGLTGLLGMYEKFDIFAD